jgi:hypothetical protein
LDPGGPSLPRRPLQWSSRGLRLTWNWSIAYKVRARVLNTTLGGTLQFQV